MSYWRHPAVILMCLFAVICGRAQAQTPFQSAPSTANADSTYQRRAPSGVAALVIQERGYNANCTALPIDMRIVESARNGTATIRDENSTIPAVGRRGANAAACVGRPIVAKYMYYQSNPGFRGVDRLFYLISIGSGEYRRIGVEITVE